jgi:hypothetical protein
MALTHPTGPDSGVRCASWNVQARALLPLRGAGLVLLRIAGGFGPGLVSGYWTMNDVSAEADG